MAQQGQRRLQPMNTITLNSNYPRDTQGTYIGPAPWRKRIYKEIDLNGELLEVIERLKAIDLEIIDAQLEVSACANYDETADVESYVIGTCFATEVEIMYILQELEIVKKRNKAVRAANKKVAADNKNRAQAEEVKNRLREIEQFKKKYPELLKADI